MHSYTVSIDRLEELCVCVQYGSPPGSLINSDFCGVELFLSKDLIWDIPPCTHTHTHAHTGLLSDTSSACLNQVAQFLSVLLMLLCRFITHCSLPFLLYFVVVSNNRPRPLNPTNHTKAALVCEYCYTIVFTS